MAVSERAGEAGVSLALAGGGLAMAVMGARMPLGSLALPGPGFFPVGLGVLLALCGLACALRAGIAGGRELVPLGGWRPWSTLGVLALAAFAFEPAGAVPTLAVMLAALFRILGGYAAWRCLAYAVAATAGAYLVFTRLLGVGLPDGLLAGLLPA
jgi:hypothetical protein